jgi:hypothetical protein
VHPAWPDGHQIVTLYIHLFVVGQLDTAQPDSLFNHEIVLPVLCIGGNAVNSAACS